MPVTNVAPEPDRESGSGSAHTPAFDTWWRRFPERLERELRELDNAGIRYERDRDMEARGLMQLRIFPRVAMAVAENGEASTDSFAELELVATYPDHYPYFRVAVTAPTLSVLGHHQHPFAKVLCLLPRSTYHWNPESDTLVKLLDEQLPRVLSAGSTECAEDASALEEHVPEPFSEYYPYERDTTVIISSTQHTEECIPESVTSGVIVLGIDGAPANGPIPVRLRSALLEVRSGDGQSLLKAPDALAARYACKIEGRWTRASEPILAEGSDDQPEVIARTVYGASVTADADKDRAPKYPTLEGATLRVRAILFPEERRWRGADGAISDGWVFAVRVQAAPPNATPQGARGRVSKDQFKRAGRRDASAPVTHHYLARASRYSHRDLSARAPELDSLRRHAVAVFGLGCLGGPSALEFARTSVGGLRLLDHDVIDAATTMRWPFGIGMVGGFKVDVLTHFIRDHYPYVSVTGEVWHLGLPRGSNPHDGSLGLGEEEVLGRMLDGASLVFDATAEWGVQHFLSEMARERGIPYLSVQGTQGGWGGVVVRITPQTEGCWVCLQHWRSEPPERGGIPRPPSDEVSGEAKVEGCSDPTYVATDFDLGQIALMGVRTAISTLTAGEPGGYPATEWDVAVLSMRTPDGRLTVPQWSTHALRRHPDCAACRARG